MLSLWSRQTRTVTRQARTYYLNEADVVVVINCVKGGMNRDALDTIIVTALVITRRARPHVERLRLYAAKRTTKKKKKYAIEMRTQIACTRRLFKHDALILPESALRRCYYPLFPDDTTAAEMLDLVTEKRSIVLQRNLGREATIFQMSNRAWRSIARYTNHKWIFLYGGRLPSDNPGSYESRKSSWLRDDSFSIIACATFKSGESFNAVPSRYRSVNQIKFIPSLSLSLNFIDRGRSKFGWVEKCFFFFLF